MKFQIYKGSMYLTKTKTSMELNEINPSSNYSPFLYKTLKVFSKRIQKVKLPLINSLNYFESRITYY